MSRHEEIQQIADILDSRNYKEAKCCHTCKHRFGDIEFQQPCCMNVWAGIENKDLTDIRLHWVCDSWESWGA